MIITILLFLLGFIIGTFLFAQFIFAIFYCFPKSLILWQKGGILFHATLTWFIAPILWLIVFFLIGFFIPSIVEFFDKNPSFGIGCNISTIGVTIYGLFTQKGEPH
jgi:hypothetical protein